MKENLRTEFALRASTVFERYAARNGGAVNTRQLIALAVREGRLRVRAAKRWISCEPNLFKAWRDGPPDEAKVKKGKLHLARGFWWRSIRWQDDIHDWDFAKSRMVVTTKDRPFERVMLSGIRFHSVDIKSVLVESGVPTKLAFDKGFQNRDQWRAFWHEIVILAAGSKDDVIDSQLGTFKSDEQLLDTIYQRIGVTEHEIEAAKQSDDDLAFVLATRNPFTLKEDVVRQEIKALRQTFNLTSRRKNRYVKAMPKELNGG